MNAIPEIKSPRRPLVTPGKVHLTKFMLEDYLDAIDAKLALADPDNTERIRWEQLKEDLGL